MVGKSYRRLVNVNAPSTANCRVALAAATAEDPTRASVVPERQLQGSLRFLLALSRIVRCEAISGDETNPQSLKNFLVRRTPTYWRL
jgi:hypothetical protein